MNVVSMFKAAPMGIKVLAGAGAAGSAILAGMGINKVATGHAKQSTGAFIAAAGVGAMALSMPVRGAGGNALYAAAAGVSMLGVLTGAGWFGKDFAV